MVVEFGFSVSDSIYFFSTAFNLLASSLSVMVTKELLKEGGKETKIPFFFFSFLNVHLMFGFTTTIQ